MLLKNERKSRIETAINKDFKYIFLFPVAYTLFCRFVPELIKSYIFPQGTFILTSKAYKNIEHSNSILTSERYFILLNVLIIFLGILAYFSIRQAGVSDDEKDTNPSINLKASDNKLKILIDTMFGRHQIFKNSNRNWPELQAAFVLFILILFTIMMIQTSWVALFLLTEYNQPFSEFLFDTIMKYGTSAQIAVQLPIAFLTLYFGIYVYIKKDYADKWKYCADTYNKLIAPVENPSISVKSLVAIDILYLDLWAKRGFCKFFQDTIIEAINVRRDWNQDKKQIYLNKISAHQLTSREAEEILEHTSQIKDWSQYYQLQLIHLGKAY